jgi:hypothetical protein
MAKQIVCAVLMVLLAGCGTWEVERLSPVPKLSCVKVADVTASSPAAAEIIREQLKAELQKKGLNVTDDCEYKIVVSWDALDGIVISSIVKLSDNKKTLIIWKYWCDSAWDAKDVSPITFSRFAAREIAKEVK